ncbi:MAG TPA: hypothetical protein VN282_07540 [Pyrinomonadaceae bacterium]|nr:hypothetical protein [Pyrinomonadaceae bacterium]
MPRTIYLRVGTAERISLPVFIDSLRAFLSTLQDIDSTISSRKNGSLIWEVVSLEKNSPPVVGVSAYQKPALKLKGYADYYPNVTEQLIENTRLLSSRGERNNYLSDSALSTLQKLAAKTPIIGPMAVYVSDNGRPEDDKPEDDKHVTLISPETFTNAKKLTEPKYRAYSSIKGNLDAISVHRKYEFKVWDEATHKPVTCYFPERDLERVKGYLRSRVRVSGVLLSNSAGSPISISVEELEPVVKRDLPTIKQMSGLIKDFTRGKSMKEYMEELSDE